MLIAGAGIIASIIGTYFVRVKEGGNPQTALNIGELVSAALMVGFSYLIITNVLPETIVFTDALYGGVFREISSFNIFLSTIVGLAAGLVIGYSTEYFTGTNYLPVLAIARQST